jgi:hypothetical protein
MVLAVDDEVHHVYSICVCTVYVHDLNVLFMYGVAWCCDVQL